MAEVLWRDGRGKTIKLAAEEVSPGVFALQTSSGAAGGGSSGGSPLTITDRSGTITAGNTAQQAAAAKADRKFLFIQNPDAAADLWVCLTGVATTGAGSTRLTPGAGLFFDVQVPNGAVSVLSATTGKPFTVTEG